MVRNEIAAVQAELATMRKQCNAAQHRGLELQLELASRQQQAKAFSSKPPLRGKERCLGKRQLHAQVQTEEMEARFRRTLRGWCLELQDGRLSWERGQVGVASDSASQPRHLVLIMVFACAFTAAGYILGKSLGPSRRPQYLPHLGLVFTARAHPVPRSAQFLW